MLTRFVKVRENTEVLYRLDVDNYNFTRKIEKHELFGVKQDTESKLSQSWDCFADISVLLDSFVEKIPKLLT